MSKEKCARECKMSDCESHCPVSDVQEGICAKNGFLYPSECAMKCRDPDLKLRWKCKTPFSFKDCGYRCAHARNADLGHHHHRKKCHRCKRKVHLPMVGESHL